jgi:hypothetical protein
MLNIVQGVGMAQELGDEGANRLAALAPLTGSDTTSVRSSSASYP